MIGIIDLGSNTVRLCIYKVIDNKLSIQFSMKETVGLAAFIDEFNQLTASGVQTAIQVITQFIEEANRFSLEKLHIIATASLRNASNSAQVKRLIESEINRSIDLLSGEEEAVCDFYGVKLATNLSDGFILDIGGGSTEIVEVQNEHSKHAFAIPYGSLNTYMKYVKRVIPKERELQKIAETIETSIKQQKIEFGKHDTIYGVGGSIRSIRKLFSKPNQEHQEGSSIRIDELNQFIGLILDKDKDCILDIIRLIPDRVHTILPGMMILSTLASYLGAVNLVVVDYGVREGYIYKHDILPLLSQGDSVNEN